MARAEVFGALGSILSLWVITAFLLYAAFTRAYGWFTGNPEKIDGFIMFLIACFGILVNICLGFVFHDEHGGAFHPAHAHDHAHGGEEHHKHETRHDAGSAASYQKVPATDEEQGGGSHGHGHNHGHSSGGCSSTAEKSHEGETTHLLASGASSYGGAGTEHRHDHDHSAHAHAHDEESAQHSSHDHSHAHSSHGHKRHVDIDSSPHTGHDHSHGHKHHTSDVNIEAAYLHVLTDLIQSIGVAIAGLVLWFYPYWQIIDPICTLIFSFIALRSTIPLMQRVFLILFDGTPSTVDWEIVMSKFEALEGVEDVHDLHIWSISSNSVSLTCHIRSTNPQRTLLQAHNICRELGCDHATIQVHDSCDERFCYSETCDGEELSNKLGGACMKGGSNMNSGVAQGGANGNSRGSSNAGAAADSAGGALPVMRQMSKRCVSRERVAIPQE